MKRLLKVGDWFAVAPVNKKALDGRVISDVIATQIEKNNAKINFIPYIARGHDGYYGDGAEQRLGSISKVRYNKDNQMLEVLPSQLDNELAREIENGKYPHVSIELMPMETEERDEEGDYKWEYFLSGFAVLGRVPPAFPDMKTAQFEINVNNNKILRFSYEGGLMADNLKDTDEKQQMDLTQPSTIEVASKTEKKQYVTDTTPLKDVVEITYEQMKDENDRLKQEIELLSNKIKDKENLINSHKDRVFQLEDEVSQLTFREFYNKAVNEGWIISETMGYKDETHKNIFESQLYDSWKSSDRQQRDEIKYRISLSKPKINTKTFGIGRQPLETVIDDNKSEDDTIRDKMDELAQKDGKKISNTNYSIYLQRAEKELKNNKR